jgi:endogenous inhibitor of DNA gyrase (YacG/DUF329 family)
VKGADMPLKYWGNTEPKCPFCDHDVNVSENELWRLYDENTGPHDVDCPACDKSFLVNSTATWTFSTEKPEDED